MSAVQRLHPDTLHHVAPQVQSPTYDRTALRPGIVHLGIGAFMRAHLAACTEAALNAGGDPAFGIIGVSLRRPDTHDALSPQHGLYALALREADADGRVRQHLQVIGCVLDVLVAPRDPQRVLALLAAATTRIISLTVTEKGYCHDPATGRLRPDHPDIRHDLQHPEAPVTAIGFIVRALQRRQREGLPGVTLMSLDNLPSNGHVLRAAVLDFAQAMQRARTGAQADAVATSFGNAAAGRDTARDAGTTDLPGWIDAHCRFPCSMVDRIVPRTTDADRTTVAGALRLHDAWPVVAERFLDWAIEDDFVAGRPDWQAGGARFVDDVAGWERLKLRMVNGAHSCIAYLGCLAGWATVDEAMRQPALRAFIEALMRDEIEPTLPPLPGLDLPRYRAGLLRRFDNPALAHRTAQIAMDGSQKLPQRLLDTIRDRLDAGQPVDRLALGVAAWLQYLGGTDERGARYPIDDPLRDELLRERDAALSAGRGDVHAEVVHWSGFAPVFGGLAGREAFVGPVARAYGALRSGGVVHCLGEH